MILESYIHATRNRSESYITGCLFNYVKGDCTFGIIQGRFGFVDKNRFEDV